MCGGRKCRFERGVYLRFVFRWLKAQSMDVSVAEQIRLLRVHRVLEGARSQRGAVLGSDAELDRNTVVPDIV